MSLLWFDSLDYVSVTRLVQVYPLATGFTTGAIHPWSGKESIQGSDAQLWIPANAGNGIGEDTAFIGYRLNVGTKPAVYADHVITRTAGGTPLIRIEIGPSTGNTIKFRVKTGDTAYLLFESSDIDATSQWLYVEWKVKHAANGSIELRINGVRQSFVENIDTLRGSFSNWDHVYIQCGVTAFGVTPVFRFADLYVADGVPAPGEFEQPFLGEVEVTRLFPGRAVQPMGWAPSLVTTTKRYLVTMFGQSNVNGRGVVAPYTGTGRATNTKIKIWDHTLPVPAWVDVTPGAGCNNFTDTWAAEMNFAELVASLHESVQPTTPAEVYLIRYGVDASYVIDTGIPGSGPLTWNPNVPNNISDDALAIVNTAVAALSGGWSSFERCDILWAQGESEGSGLGIGSFGVQNYIARTNEVFDHIEANIPVTVEWHRAVAQNIPNVAWQGTFLEGLQQLQTGGQLRGKLIETRDLVRFNDDEIHMGEADMDIYARRFYLSWAESCGFTRYIQDDFYDEPALDPLWIGSDTPASGIFFDQAPEVLFNMNHTPAIALNNKMRLSSDADGKQLLTAIGGFFFPTIVLDSTTAWTFRYMQVEAVVDPKDVTGRIYFGLA